MRDEKNAPLARRADTVPDTRRDPFAAFRIEMDRLFDSFLSPARFGQFGMAFSPALDVTDNGNEVRVRAELPGVDEKDVEIHVDGDMLTIRGEKRQERTDDSEERRVVERAFGAFERSVRLPFTPESEAVKAVFKDGVLTVTAKRPSGWVRRDMRIPIVKL